METGLEPIRLGHEVFASKNLALAKAKELSSDKFNVHNYEAQLFGTATEIGFNKHKF